MSAALGAKILIYSRTNTHAPLLKIHYFNLGKNRPTLIYNFLLQGLAIIIGFPIHSRLRLDWWCNPVTTLPRWDFGDVHSINLLQSLALRLAHEEIHNKHSCKIAACEDIAVLEANVRGDEGREESDQKVPCPVGGGDQRHGACSVVAGKQFTNDAPDDGAPGGGVEGNEETGENDHGFSGRGRIGRVGVIKGEGTDGGENDKGDGHTDAADN